MRHFLFALFMLPACASPSFELGEAELSEDVTEDVGTDEVMIVRPWSIMGSDAGPPDVAKDSSPDVPVPPDVPVDTADTALPSASIVCSSTETCSLPSKTCCVASGAPRCEPSCAPEKSYACDSAADCSTGQKCFLMAAGGSRCGTTGDTQLCASNDECASKQCVMYSGWPSLRKCM